MHKTRVKIWATGEWPGESTHSVFNPIPKKRDLKEYKTIGPLVWSHTPVRFYSSF